MNYVSEIQHFLCIHNPSMNLGLTHHDGVQCVEISSTQLSFKIHALCFSDH